MMALEQDAPVMRWGVCLGLVLLMHVGVLAVWCWIHAMHPVQAPSEPPQAVMLELAPLPTAPPTAPTDLPPGPQQQEQREARPIAEPQPVATPQPQQPLIENPEAALPQRAVEQQNDAHANTEVAQTSAPPSLQATAAAQYAAQQTVAGAAAQSMVTWQAQVLGHLEAFKRYPRAAQRRHQHGAVQVRYTVDRQGRVLSVALAGSSGHDPLDEEALSAVQRASPLPPPPAEIPGDPVTVTTPVTFTLRR